MARRVSRWVRAHKLVTALVAVGMAGALGAAALASLRYDHRATVAEAGARLELLASMRVFHELPPGAVLLDDRFDICADSSDPTVTRTMTVPDVEAAASFFRASLVEDGWSERADPNVLALERELDGWDATIVLHVMDGRATLTGTVRNGDYEPGCLR